MKELKTSLEGIEIMDSWKVDLEALRDKRDKISQEIRMVEAERKKQPSLILKSLLDEEYYVTNRWFIEKGSILVCESKRKATPEEVRIYIEERE